MEDVVRRLEAGEHITLVDLDDGVVYTVVGYERGEASVTLKIKKQVEKEP